MAVSDQEPGSATEETAVEEPLSDPTTVEEPPTEHAAVEEPPTELGPAAPAEVDGVPTEQRATEPLMEPTPGELDRRQRDRWGGISWGAVFFGWVVAIGIGSMLTGLVVAAGTAVSLTEVPRNVADARESISVGGGIVIVAIAVLAYLAGGYVAGRMTRFDGARQGVGVWLFALVVAVALALVGAIAGGEYNVFSGLDLPRVPVDEGTLTSTGAIVLAAVVVGSLGAAIAGGALGQRYHRRVDSGYEAAG